MTSYWSGSKRGRKSSQWMIAAHPEDESMAVWRWPIICPFTSWPGLWLIGNYSQWKAAAYKDLKMNGGVWRTDKKENQIILIYKEIQSGAVAKSYMRREFLIYEEMRKYFPIYEEAVSHIWLCNCSLLNFLIYEENLIFFFSVWPLIGQALNWVEILAIERPRLIKPEDEHDSEKLTYDMTLLLARLMAYWKLQPMKGLGL